jgi:putative methionine-R-sulfoxide reductase with GAF domain
LITDLFSFYHAGIFLLDDTGEYAVLQAASSSGGKRMLERGHKLEVARQGLVGAAVRQNKAQIIMDVSTAPDFYKNPDLPETVSEAAFPLAIQDRIIGVLDIQSTSGNVFSREDMQVIQALGDQIALAIQNTRLLREREASMALLERATLQDIRKVWRKKVGDKKTAFRYSASEIVAVSPQGQKVSKKAKGVHTLEIPIVLRGQTIGKFELNGLISIKREGFPQYSSFKKRLYINVSLIICYNQSPVIFLIKQGIRRTQRKIDFICI